MRIRPGTSGFSYAAWRGRFYPRDLPAPRMLAHYAARLPAVEVNATFYRMPRAATLAAWRAEVPADFVFALKAPQRVTHARRLAGAEDAVRYFYGVAAELGPSLGPVLYQLPPGLEKDVPRLRDFLALLPAGGRAAFELRDPSWLADDVLGLLAGEGCALCVTDTDDRTTPLVATARFGYLRLRRAGYDTGALRRWLERIRAQPWDEAYVFFKHEDQAVGPALALELWALARAEEAGAGAAPA